ncbi:MAG: biotin synthase BioB [Calditerrivibrio sp.]|nr:biotin synthase BioB [Calditerrivibrio sp.]MCA1932682.1 biotin synthase BioB [Calditerrivibrio sp.]
MLKQIKEEILNKGVLTNDQISYLINYPEDSIEPLLDLAYEIKKFYFSKDIDLCSIVNVKSGLCSEDCTFCAQSSHYDTGAVTYEYIDDNRLKSAIEFYRSKGVKRFSIVTSGKTLDEKTFQKVLKDVAFVKSTGMIPDVSIGILSKEQLLKLKEAGLNGFHHNLETSRSFFKNICTTHDYEEDVETVKNAIEAGLYVCSGGIFGIGESWEDRLELAMELKDLKVPSIPINFLNPIKGTPLEGTSILSENEALKIIAIYRILLPDRHIRVCGGRNTIFSLETKKRILRSGASGIMVGDYLTTTGFPIESDMEDLKNEK